MQARRPKLEIRKAVYGDLSKPDGGKVDVTAKLAERVKDGQLEVAADNNLAGDPAVNVVKQLRVDYVLDGVAKSITVARERRCCDCPPRKRSACRRRRDLSLENGQLSLTAAEAGRYTRDDTASEREKTVVDRRLAQARRADRAPGK